MGVLSNSELVLCRRYVFPLQTSCGMEFLASSGRCAGCVVNHLGPTFNDMKDIEFVK